MFVVVQWPVTTDVMRSTVAFLEILGFNAVNNISSNAVFEGAIVSNRDGG